MNNILFQYFPKIEGDELIFIQNIIKGFDENRTRQFITLYRQRRKDPQIILVTTLLGFIGIAGIQRFLLDQAAMGTVYLLTVGFCWIGTIIDLSNYKRLCFEYNKYQVQEVITLLDMSV